MRTRIQDAIRDWGDYDGVILPDKRYNAVVTGYTEIDCHVIDPETGEARIAEPGDFVLVENWAISGDGDIGIKTFGNGKHKCFGQLIEADLIKPI